MLNVRNGRSVDFAWVKCIDPSGFAVLSLQDDIAGREGKGYSVGSAG